MSGDERVAGVVIPDPADNELVVDGPLTFPLDRREFVKLTSTGLLVLFAIDPAAAVQETDRQPAGRPVTPAECDENSCYH